MSHLHQHSVLDDYRVDTFVAGCQFFKRIGGGGYIRASEGLRGRTL